MYWNNSIFSFKKVGELDKDVEKVLNKIIDETDKWTSDVVDSLEDISKREAKAIMRERDECINDLGSELRPAVTRCDSRLDSLLKLIQDFSAKDPMNQQRVQTIMGGISEACSQISHVILKLHRDYSILSDKVYKLDKEVGALDV